LQVGVSKPFKVDVEVEHGRRTWWYSPTAIELADPADEGVY
jgi:hypothetical protein